MKKICFVASGKIQGFYKRDFELLSENHSVLYFYFPISPKNNKKINFIFDFCINFLKLFKTLGKTDICFSWFADIHSLTALIFSKLLNKSFVLVTGGYDVETMPEIGYGTNDLLHKYISKFVLKYSTVVLPFSEYSLNKVKQMQPKANAIMIPLACDINKFIPKGKKELIVLTVGFVKKDNLKRKGLEKFVKVAKYVIPEVKFIIVGSFLDDSIDYLRSISPENVEFTGYLSDKELLKLYQKSKIYCQLSYQEGEGAGGAVGEAMACECIPIVSEEATALRETVEDAGYYISLENEKKIADVIKTALKNQEMGKKARNRIVDSFSMQRRSLELKKIIENMI